MYVCMYVHKVKTFSTITERQTDGRTYRLMEVEDKFNMYLFSLIFSQFLSLSQFFFVSISFWKKIYNVVLQNCTFLKLQLSRKTTCLL